MQKLEEHSSAFTGDFGPSPDFAASPRHGVTLQKKANQSICANIFQKTCTSECPEMLHL